MRCASISGAAQARGTDRGAVDDSRARLKPEISGLGEHGIPLRDELELEHGLVPSDGPDERFAWLTMRRYRISPKAAATALALAARDAAAAFVESSNGVRV